MTTKRLSAMCLALIMVLGLAAGCTGAPSNEPSPTPGSAEATPAQGSSGGDVENTAAVPVTKDTLIFALDAEPATLDPYMHSKQQGFTVATLIFETLVKKDADGNFVPWLATEWEFVDDTTIVFKLRDDVTFHDGSKMTAEDVRYSLTLGAQSSFSQNLFGSIDVENTKVVDDTTLELKLLNPYAPLMEALASFRGAILCKSAREAMGDEAFGRAPVGTGPMMFSQWVAGDRIEMTAYEGYWGDPLPFNAATARIIVESSARAIELETGGVDIAMELAFADWDRINENPDTVLISGKSQSSSFLILNNSMEPFSDIRVRQALASALDLQALVNVVYQGHAAVADSYYIPGILGYKKVGPMEYNPEKAKALLAEAGYPDGFTIKYYVYETAINLAVSEVVQNMWAQIGVTTDIQIVDLATQTELNNSGQLTVAHVAPTVAMPDPDAALVSWPIYRNISIRHNDQHIQDLLDLGRATYDTEERAKVYEELQDYIYSKTYNIPIAFPEAAFGTRGNITGIRFAPSLVPDLTQVRFQ